MKTILIVEDDKAIRESLRELLEMEGYGTFIAGNGQEALEILRSGKKPSLILLDLMMPVMDGFEFRKIQSEDPDFNSIPIVIMSADGHTGPKKAAIGAVDYLRKPVNVDDLLERLERAMES